MIELIFFEVDIFHTSYVRALLLCDIPTQVVYALIYYSTCTGVCTAPKLQRPYGSTCTALWAWRTAVRFDWGLPQVPGV